MPVYEYRAEEPETAPECCRQTFELVQRISEDALTACPKCGTKIRRVIGATAFITKTQKSIMSDANLKKNGFKKLVNEGGGKFRDALA